MPILIVDDERKARRIYRTALAHLGYDLYEANSGPTALEKFQERKYDAAVLDLEMPGMDGFDLLETMQKRGVTTPAVLVMEDGDVPNRVRAMELGVIDFLPKVPAPDRLREMVSDVLIRHIPAPRIPDVRDCEYYLRFAKRSINLRDFRGAKEYLIKALDLDPNSIQAIHLVGVMLEMREEHQNGIRYSRL
jgi:DNA-binding response OmpR family regulator